MYSSYLRSKIDWNLVDVKQKLDYQKFYEWLDSIERLVFKRTQLFLNDIDDEPYRQWYDAGLSPSHCASIIINDIRATYGEEY